MNAKYQVKVEITETLSTTKYSQHGWPILCIINMQTYLCFPTTPTILLSSLLLVDRDADPSSLLLCAGKGAQVDFCHAFNLAVHSHKFLS